MTDMTDPFSLARELDEFTVTPGALGFVVFAVLGLAVWMLLKSMTRQLNRIEIKDQDRS